MFGWFKPACLPQGTEVVTGDSVWPANIYYPSQTLPLKDFQFLADLSHLQPAPVKHLQHLCMFPDKVSVHSKLQPWLETA